MHNCVMHKGIKGTKSIDNWFTHNTNNKIDWDSFIHNTVVYKNPIRKRQERREIIEGVKSIDNWFHDHPKKKWRSDLIGELSSSIKQKPPRHQEAEEENIEVRN